MYQEMEHLYLPVNDFIYLLQLAAPPLLLSSVPMRRKKLLREESLSLDFYLFQTSAQEGFSSKRSER
jgi:hypothetical protein